MILDTNTLMQIMGLQTNANPDTQPVAQPRYTPGLADMSRLGNSAAVVPAPVAPVVAAPSTPAAPATTPAPSAQMHKGGFTTGNILTALLGSNFGYK